MDIPAEKFEMYRHPSSRWFFVVFFAVFLFYIFFSKMLELLAPASIRPWIFPILPLVLTIVTTEYMRPSCRINVNADGLTLVTMRSSIGMTAGEQSWLWRDLEEFKRPAARRSDYLKLRIGGQKVTVFSGDTLKLYELLKTRFPERESKKIWT